MSRINWLSTLVIVSLLLTTLGMVAPAALAQEPTAAPAGEGQPLKMAIILKNLVNPYFVAMGDGAKAAAAELNIELSVLAPEQPDSVEEQSNMVENLIQAKADAIVLVPADSKAIVPAVEKAKAAGIPVIAADTRVIGTDVNTFVGYDSKELAAIMGRWLKDYIVANMGSQGKVVLLDFWTYG